MKIDITKPVKTYDGRHVEIISDKGRGEFPLLGYIGENLFPDTWTSVGKYYGDADSSNNDLIQEPVRKTLWVNVYRGEGGLVLGLAAHQTKKSADSRAVSDRIACIKVTYHDGQFDEE